MPSFITDTPEKLKVEWISAAKTDLVAITGDRVKILYEGDSKQDAQTVYNDTKKHFDDRVAERSKGTTPQEQVELEAKVRSKPFRKARF